ncbi:MAG: hypothetical protein A3A94_01445 [Candidatus Portnoybacteria bacterium RIFCSPLOWO2_01_FULL_43_11]|uniref:Uncharacterized protein n=1 Tax=Candidatus Portnoybacteria bacterium RIFCSPLOWO2_01_FULL_43_11 TaxID=1802000 RepID=A0A1G2FIX0_9BACT|nr:MAG: hypothetical protein A3A94_01445 [Candidatus Portnoybacteria bacterium RIFCSPLOWO2_01_FULL_43_11]
MNNTKLLTQEQLKDPTIFEKIRRLTEDIVWHILTKEAYNLALNLEKSLEAANLKAIAPKLTQEYESIIIRLKLTALPMLSDEESVKIVREHFLEGLGPEIDIKNRLTAKLFSLPLTPRDEIRQELQIAIQDNRQRIGSLAISQWLTDYNNFSHPDQRTNISPREYLLQSRQVSGLSEEDKNKLYTLFHVYDHLLLVTSIMSEEEMNEIIKNSLPSDVKKPVSPLQKVPSPLPKTKTLPPPAQPPSTIPSPSQPLKSSIPPYQFPKPTFSGRDLYKEPIEEPPMPGRVEPRIEGNIVDLKNRQ